MAFSPVTVVTGARQAGKSTLVQVPEILQDRVYLSLDDLDTREQAERAPQDLVRRAPSLVLDEVQRSPALLLAIKQSVDQQRVPGRFILTGSANLLLLRRVGETLAGRASYLTLWPLTRREQLGFGEAGGWSAFFSLPTARWRDWANSSVAPPEPWKDLAQRGGYPLPAYHLGSPGERLRWFEGYARAYLERDIRDLSAVEHAADLRRLMRAAALRLGGLLNQTDLARDIGLAPSTAQRYLHLLEATYQMVRLPAYAVSRTKRLTKASKLYWSDTGLALYLSGEIEPRGAHLENLIATDLLAWREVEPYRPEILYWRTVKGAEVDFVIAWRGKLLCIEVKAATSVGYRHGLHLKTFMSEYPEAVGGLVLYDGEETFWLSDRILALPWWRVI